MSAIEATIKECAWLCDSYQKRHIAGMLFAYIVFQGTPQVSDPFRSEVLHERQVEEQVHRGRAEIRRAQGRDPV